MFTTGLWYHRLCRVLRDQDRDRRHAEVSGQRRRPHRRQVVRSVELPLSIGLTSLRSLGRHMADLVGNGARLNLLSLEALAAAEQLGAEICLATGRKSATSPGGRPPGFAVRLVSG
ncbi:MAG: hypothetical protein M3N32_06445 [Actinomycetota bacterium]|nr:hypothetical protein [Actinomycetota bacterium]